MKLLRKTVIFCLGLSPETEFTYELLYKLVPFAPVSVRGAVMGLKGEAAVSVYQRRGQTRIQLTSVGAELLRASFPALKPSSGKKDRVWTVCVFTGEAGTSFRSARTELLRQGFFSLERGVYCLPNSAPADLTNRLSHLHLLHRVLMFETRRMVVGDESAIVRSLFDMRQLGKEAEALEKTLTSINRKVIQKSKLHPQTRELFLNLIPQLMTFFARDLTIPDIYFPQDVRLSDIKPLLSQVCAEILPKL